MTDTRIDTLELRDFTAFKRLKIDFSPKINVIIGANGTGKTQLLKAAHAMCVGDSKIASGENIRKDDVESLFARYLTSLFMPLDGKLGKMRRHGAGNDEAGIKATFSYGGKMELSFKTGSTKNVQFDKIEHLKTQRSESVFFPTKEVLSFMQGFVSLYQHRELTFDQSYHDICLQLDLLPMRKENLTKRTKWAMEELEKICGGRFIFYGGGKVTFKFAKDDTEFSANAIAEGFRKAGMLSRLLETGTIRPGISGPLFWDEPEANMNPKLMELLVKILLDLSRNGQQIVLATHNYVLLKWFDLLSDKGKEDNVLYHALSRNDNNQIVVESKDNYRLLDSNAIANTFNELYDAEIVRSLGGGK